mgnify:CR=1 FL=1
MNPLKVSDTFTMTYQAFHKPECRQLVSMGGSRSSKSYSILQMLMLELIKRKNILIHNKNYFLFRLRRQFLYGV